jgi:hypothetical protein
MRGRTRTAVESPMTRAKDRATRHAAALVACLAAVVPLGCAAPPSPRPVAKAIVEPRWQDVFETVPELLVVVRAKAAREDRVYGPLLRRALQLARERSGAVGSTHALEAMSDAEELVVGLRPDSVRGAGEQPEMVLVARGVRADIDPGKLTGDDGQLLWGPGPSGNVRELVQAGDAHGHPGSASLFELPGRTWVIAEGDARTRAREAFAHPSNRPGIDLDPQALAIIRVDGPSLVARVRPLQDLGGLAAIGRHLRALTIVLPPGADRAVRATWTYTDDDAAALSEVALGELVGAASRAGKAGWLRWIAGAKVERAQRSVVASAPLPPQLVDGLLQAGTAPLGVDPPPP